MEGDSSMSDDSDRQRLIALKNRRPGHLTAEEISWLIVLAKQQAEELAWWHDFRLRGENKDYDSQVAHGCICPSPTKKPDGPYDWQIESDCQYHATAARYPSNHGISWNCPTFYDKCNCRDKLKCQAEEIEELKAALAPATRVGRATS